MLSRFCILDLSKHPGQWFKAIAILARHLQCRYSQDRLFRKIINRLEWTSKWFVKRGLKLCKKTICWAFFKILLSLLVSHATGDHSVLCDHYVWWDKTKGLVYSHKTDHCLLWSASSKKRERLLLVYVFAVFASGARTVKMSYFT